jgi:hypothetical protein
MASWRDRESRLAGRPGVDPTSSRRARVGRSCSLSGSPRPDCAGPTGYLARLWRGDGWVMRRTSRRTTPKPRSVSLFQGSLGCPPRSRGPVAGPPGSCSAPSSTPNSNGDAALPPPRRAGNRSSRFGMRKLRKSHAAGATPLRREIGQLTRRDAGPGCAGRCRVRLCGSLPADVTARPRAAWEAARPRLPGRDRAIPAADRLPGGDPSDQASLARRRMPEPRKDRHMKATPLNVHVRAGRPPGPVAGHCSHRSRDGLAVADLWQGHRW